MIVLPFSIFLIAILGCASAELSVGILVHGYNTFARDWRRVAIGDVITGARGRILQTLLVASTIRYLSPTAIKCIFWGSGVDSVEQNVQEGEFTFRSLISLLESDKCGFSEIDVLTQAAKIQLREDLCRTSVFCSASKNTVTEIEAAISHFRKHDINVVILISSATHAPRCLRDIQAVLGKLGEKNYDPIVLVSPSTVCYPDSRPQEVVIFEPPHLPASTNEKTAVHHGNIVRRNKLTERILNIAPDDLTEFNDNLDDLLNRLSSSATNPK